MSDNDTSLAWVYLVMQRGIYRQEILGIFSTEEAARKAAYEAIAHHDHDGYHDVEVCSAPMDIEIDDVQYIGHYRKKHISRYTKDDVYKERPITWYPNKSTTVLHED